jgi:hypothetical protein
MTEANQTFEFLWVNKDVNSPILSRNHPQAARVVNQHVQLGIARENKINQIKSLHESAVVVRKIARQGYAFRVRPQNNREVGEEAACPVSSSSKSSKREGLRRAPKKSSQSFAARQAKRSQVKPFNSAEIVLNSQTYSMLQYHFSHSIVTLTRSDILAREQTPERHRYSRYLQDIVRICLSSELHMYPLLSATAGRMTIVSKAHERHASHFMHNATRLLREYFLTPNPAIDSQIIRNILHLSVSEWYRGNHNAAWIHLHILARLVHVLDLENIADRYLLDNACCIDIYFAIETGATPIFPLSWLPKSLSPRQMSEIRHYLDKLLCQPQWRPLWDPFRAITTEERLLGLTTGPFSFLSRRLTGEEYYVGRRAVSHTHRPGKGFAEALVEGIFNPPMKSIVEDLVAHLEISTYSSVCCEHGRPSVPFMGKRTMALLHRLVSTITRHAIDECCRLAAIIMMSYVSNPMAWRSNGKVVPRLQGAVLVVEKEYREPRSNLSAQLLLWVVVVGMFAAPNTQEFTWFLNRAHGFASNLALGNYVQLHDTVGKFIHFETAQHECLSRLAASLAGTVQYSLQADRQHRLEASRMLPEP